MAQGFAQNDAYDVAKTVKEQKPENLPVATLAGGCFWCIESEFRRLDGVVYTISGYTGGQIENPSYEQITTGKTGHAEATEIYYDPEIISYEDLLTHFFTLAHDPTQVDGQGVDKGPQYRSAVFYHDEEQKRATEDMIATLEDQGRFKKPIVTEINPAQTFWHAEDYHQQFYEKYEERTGVPHIRMMYKMQKAQ